MCVPGGCMLGRKGGGGTPCPKIFLTVKLYLILFNLKSICYIYSDILFLLDLHPVFMQSS